MTGLDCLKQKLMENYKLTEKQAEQAVGLTNVHRILETLAMEEGLLEKVAVEDIRRREEDIARRERELANAKSRFYNHEIREAREKLREEEYQHRKEFDRLKDLERLEAQIAALETPEAKDRLRMYEMFKQDVYVQTPQNNSVYIAGLASILTGTAIWNFDPDALADETREQNEGRKKSESWVRRI